MTGSHNTDAHNIDLRDIARSPGQSHPDLLRSLDTQSPALEETTGVGLTELPCVPMTSIRLRPGTEGAAAIENTLGVDLPSRCGQVTGDMAPGTQPPGLAVVWLGPDEFLTIGTRDPGERRLRAALGDHSGLICDVGANRTVICLHGTQAREVLTKGISHDLHPKVFPVGRAVSCALGNAPVLLWRTGEGSWFLMPRSSFTGYVLRWCKAAAQEFLPAP